MSKKIPDDHPASPFEEETLPVGTTQPNSTESNGGTASPQDADVSDSVVGSIESLRNELAEAQDQVLRAHAELDNFRKRTRREIEEQLKYAKVPLVRELVDVLDNLNRAISLSKQSSVDDLTQGVKLVAEQLNGVLVENGCIPMEVVGQPFDPNLHESIQMVVTDEVAPGTIVQEIQKGYQVHDRVARPAKVFVATDK